jgi:hypothetical protein
MMYSKPEVSLLGSAKDVIEILNRVKFHTKVGDGAPGVKNLPAYDLDE